MTTDKLEQFRNGQTGWHPDIPFEEYLLLDALSRSGISLLRRTPAHYHSAITGVKKSYTSDSMKFGSALHCAVLEPEKFDKIYIERPQGLDRRKTEGKKLWKMLIEEYGENYILTSDEMFDIEMMAHRIRTHPLLAPHFETKLYSEVTGLFRDPEHNVLCKIRPDIIAHETHTLLDIKTTSDASPRGFAMSAFKWDYHIQSTLYLEGASVISKEPFKRFLIVAVEKTPPYEVVVYQIKNDVMALAAEQIRQAIELYAQCRDSGVWPGYTEEVHMLDFSTWQRSNISEDISFIEDHFIE